MFIRLGTVFNGFWPETVKTVNAKTVVIWSPHLSAVLIKLRN